MLLALRVRFQIVEIEIDPWEAIRRPYLTERASPGRGQSFNVYNSFHVKAYVIDFQ